MKRRYPDRPLVGVGAIIFREDRALLVQRGREPAYGKWSVPGGLVELGESLQDAVRREVREEVGLEVKVRDLIAVLDRVIPDAEGRVEYHYILLDFLCESEEGEPVAGSDVLNCVFEPLAALDRYPLTEGTLQVIRQAIEHARGVHAPVYYPDL